MIAVRSGPEGGGAAALLTNEAGDVTSHLQGLFYRTIRLMENGIRPVYVFDGKPPDLKQAELDKRREKRADAEEALKEATEQGDVEAMEKFDKRSVRVTKEHNDECKRLLKLMGIPYIEAPSEAEGQAAILARAGKVYAAASEDMDTLTFGAPMLLRHLTFSAAKKTDIMEIHLDAVLSGLGITMDQFVDLCILCGCDYCGKIRGIGHVKALEYIKEYGSIEEMLKRIDRSKFIVPDHFPFVEARKLFKEMETVPMDDLTLKWNEPDGDGLRAFLCDEKGFQVERVDGGLRKLQEQLGKSVQGHLDAFFGRPTVTPNDKKRKAQESLKGKKAKVANKGKGFRK